MNINAVVCLLFLWQESLWPDTEWLKSQNVEQKKDWAYFIEEIAEAYEDAEKITLVMDNLNTHKPGSPYEVFTP